MTAGINLPEYPADCRKHEPHASIKAGDEARAVIVAERSALNRANARTDRCAAFYDSTRAGFGTPAK